MTVRPASSGSCGLSRCERSARAANADVVKTWVEQASAGFLTAELRHGVFAGNISVGRKDGLPLDGPDAMPSSADRPVTGVLFSLSFSSVRKLDRRWKTVTTEVRDAVRSVLVRYVADAPMDCWSALSNFEHRNGLR